MHAGELSLTIRDQAPAERPNFDALMAAHRPLVLRTAYRLLGRMEDAQDVAQEVFLRLLRHLDSVDGDPRAWLYRVTVNVCNDQFRRRMTLVDAAEVQIEDAAPGPERVLEMGERKQLLEAGLRRLPDRERAAIVLRDIEGLTTREVAAALEVEEVTVRTQIASARMKLAKFVRSRT